MTTSTPIRIAMAVSNDLLTDRRVWRNVGELCRLGYAVSLWGVHKGRGAGVAKEQAEGANPNVRHLRTWFKCGPGFYAEYNVRLLLRMFVEPCDIIWCNDADTLPAMALAARLRGKRLVADMHEIMSEVPEVQGRPRVQRVWRWVERRFLPMAQLRYTVSDSFADYYLQHYHTPMQVLRNMGVEAVDDLSAGGQSLPEAVGQLQGPILLYQGAVNKGRGVDWAIDAMQWLLDCHLVVAGVGDEWEQMKQYAATKPWGDRVLFLGRLSPEQLVPLTRKATVGLVMLEDMGLSYRLTLPNRVGDFVRAAVPMVVSDMPEMSRVVRQYGVGEVINGVGAEPLARAVQRVLQQSPWPLSRFEAAKRDFDWNTEREKIGAGVRSLFE